MSFILIGDLIINLMCVVKVQFTPDGAGGYGRLCVIMLAGDPLVFDGPEADTAWPKFQKMGTPLETV